MEKSDEILKDLKVEIEAYQTDAVNNTWGTKNWYEKHEKKIFKLLSQVTPDAEFKRYLDEKITYDNHLSEEDDEDDEDDDDSTKKGYFWEGPIKTFWDLMSQVRRMRYNILTDANTPFFKKLSGRRLLGLHQEKSKSLERTLHNIYIDKFEVLDDILSYNDYHEKIDLSKCAKKGNQVSMGQGSSLKAKNVNNLAAISGMIVATINDETCT